MREPHDIFVKEFLQHPVWDEVFERLEGLAIELKERLCLGTKEDFEERKGRVEGVYEAMALLRGLINKAKG